MSGSVAALARWNSTMQPAKMSSERSMRTVRTLAAGSCADLRNL